MTDAALIGLHRGYEDPEAGIAETFLQPVLGGGRSLAVLSRPVGPARKIGWVICHSIGLEQVHMARLDVMVARALSRAGFPTLRYQGQGYGDSDPAEGVGLSSHLRDASDAVRLMRAQEGVERVGVLGARFGAAVAALVADREGLDLMGLWEPATSGSKFMRDFLRQRVLSEMVEGDSGRPSGMEQIYSELRSQGWADIKGFVLSQEAHDEISNMDLLKDVNNFKGSSLILSISRNGAVSAALAELSRHLQSLGGQCVVETVRHATAPQLGQFHFQTIDGGRGKRDTQFDLDLGVAASTVQWATDQVGEAGTWTESSTDPVSLPVEPGQVDSVTQYPVFVPYGKERLAAVMTVPAGEPRALVLLVTGIGAPRAHRFQVWAKVARRLAGEGYASIRMDYGGLGDSTGTLRELPLIDAPWEEAAEVARFGMRALGLDRFAVAGNCLGATVSLMLPAEMPECMASLGILTRLRDPSNAYQLLHRGRRTKLAAMVRANPFLRRVLIRRVRGLKGRALPGVEDQLSRALSHARMMFVYSPADDDVYTPDVQVLLDQMLRRLPADRRARFEVRVVPEGPLARLESLAAQSVVIETATAWLLKTLPELTPEPRETAAPVPLQRG